MASKDVEYRQGGVRSLCIKILIKEPFPKKIEGLLIVWQGLRSQVWRDTRDLARSNCIEVEMCAEYHTVKESSIKLERGDP